MSEATDKKRILYGVHGYGRGHAARAQAILPDLTQRYDVLVLAGDDAYDQLHADYDVRRIPVLRYYHTPDGKRSNWLTAKHGLESFGDLWFRGEGMRQVQQIMREFRPDVVLSDSETWSLHAAQKVGVPRISFDHYGIIVHCHLEMSAMDHLICSAESLVYHMLVGHPDRAIVVAFYEGMPRHESVSVVGPLIRKEARAITPTDDGHLLTYFSNSRINFTDQIAAALEQLDCPVKVYGPKGEGRSGNVEYCPIGNEPFLRDLASARAVFCTAGNQLISEAIHFGKPLLLMPEQALEQRLNAQYIERWGGGQATIRDEVTVELLQGFLVRRDEMAANIIEHRRAGLAAALAAIDRAVTELTVGPGRAKGAQ